MRQANYTAGVCGAVSVQDGGAFFGRIAGVEDVGLWDGVGADGDL